MTPPFSPAAVLAPGFSDPVGGANAVFRAVLTAMSLPGRVVEPAFGIDPPAPLSPAAGAVLLTLADLDTPVWLDPSLNEEPVRAWVRFHCGCPLAVVPAEAVFAVTGPDADIGRFSIGSADRPDTSATVIVEVPELATGAGRQLTGPGIDGVARLSVPALGEPGWRALQDNQRLFPEGVDVIFTAGRRLACLPRTTLIGEADPCMSR